MSPIRIALLLCLVGAVLGSCSASLVEFDRIDVTSPSFDVDAGLSSAARWHRIQSAASVPLKGWNSYDGWDWSVTERDVVNNIDYIAANLSALGYNIVTIDYYWYLNLTGSPMYVDEYGRLQPDPYRFPSSANNSGFKKIAAYTHSKGLLFGIHTMRGISHAAVLQRSRVLSSNYTADEVYDRHNQCSWTPGNDNTTFFSLNMSHPGGQLFYDSLYAQYAEWGVDFIKNDCVYANYVPDQIDAVSAAIDNSGRRMLYSLSPGSDNNSWAARIVNETNMYRVTDDTWDRWENSIRNHFLSAQHMQPYIGYANGRYGLPSWPDLDMLPLGWIGVEGANEPPSRWCNLTQDEQQTLMSLWTIFRSPLMYGGDLQHPDPYSLSLITNVEALAITDNSTNTDYIVSGPTLAIWRSDDSAWQQSGVSYFSVHNIGDTRLEGLTVSTAQLRGKQSGTSCTMRDVWAQKDVQSGSTLTFTMRPHQSGLYSLRDCSSDMQAQTTQRHRHSRLTA